MEKFTLLKFPHGKLVSCLPLLGDNLLEYFIPFTEKKNYKQRFSKHFYSSKYFSIEFLKLSYFVVLSKKMKTT